MPDSMPDPCAEGAIYYCATCGHVHSALDEGDIIDFVNLVEKADRDPVWRGWAETLAMGIREWLHEVERRGL